MGSESENSISTPSDTADHARSDESAQERSDAIALPSHVAGSGALDRLVDTARDYARAAVSDNTRRAYAKDWAHYTRWCRMKGAEPLPPSPEMIGLYLADLAAPRGKAPALSVSTIERRLSGLAWTCAQRGVTLDRENRHIAAVLAGIRRKHARPPVQKEAILPEDIRAMVATLPYDLRGLRDRAILLLGYAGGLRRSEIICLDHGRDDTPDAGGWIEILEGGLVLTLDTKTGWREVEIGRGASEADLSCARSGAMASFRADRLRADLHRRLARWPARSRAAPQRPACRAADQALRARCGPALRPARGRAAAPLFGPQPARRTCQQRRDRRTPCPETSRPCQRGDDPPLPAPPRPVPREPHQGGRSVKPSVGALTASDPSAGTDRPEHLRTRIAGPGPSAHTASDGRGAAAKITQEARRPGDRPRPSASGHCRHPKQPRRKFEDRQAHGAPVMIEPWSASTTAAIRVDPQHRANPPEGHGQRQPDIAHPMMAMRRAACGDRIPVTELFPTGRVADDDEAGDGRLFWWEQDSGGTVRWLHATARERAEKWVIGSPMRRPQAEERST